MRFMVIVKATPETEKEGAVPDPQLMVEVGKHNEELMRAGILLTLGGLHPSSKGARIKFSGKSRTVVDGPFTETYEVEIRQVFEMEDFAPVLSEEQIQHKVQPRAELPNQTANR